MDTKTFNEVFYEQFEKIAERFSKENIRGVLSSEEYKNAEPESQIALINNCQPSVYEVLAVFYEKNEEYKLKREQILDEVKQYLNFYNGFTAFIFSRALEGIQE